MHFYRPLKNIKAITFDLDDTLYDNSQCIAEAEATMADYLKHYSGLQHITEASFKAQKQQILQYHPEIYHDVVLWREETIKYILTVNQIPTAKIASITTAVMDKFIFWRHKIDVPKTSFDVLDYLAEKYPLAVITNGNVEVSKIKLDNYFQFSLRGGPDGRSKPFSDMFHLASLQLGIAPENILHIGDNLITDVAGAINHGMQACWLNVVGLDIFQQSDASVLPNVEIRQLSALYNLL